jgi:hypothetical protein
MLLAPKHRERWREPALAESATLLILRAAAMLIRMVHRSLVGVMAGVCGMPVRHMGVMAAFLVCSTFVVLRGFAMMPSCVLMVLSGFGMMFSAFMGHGASP